MPNSSNESTPETQALLACLRAFCFPYGEESARSIRSITTTESGEIRMSPEARWIPFTAVHTVDCTRSGFRWEARLNPGKITSIAVTDAYEGGRGRLVIKLGGVIPVKKIMGPEADQGELQRYLAGIVSCPPILLNHSSLEYRAEGPLTLRVCDREDPAEAAVNIDISGEGCPLVCWANRPRLVGKQSVLTPWSAAGTAFRERQGLRVPSRLEASWNLPEGPFAYFRCEITSFETA